MRTIYLILLMCLFSGCAVKPEYTLQKATGIEIGLSKETNEIFRLIDRKNHLIAKTKATGKTLFFSLPTHTSPSLCYAIINNKGEPLFDKNKGIKITSVYHYQQKKIQRNIAQQKYNSCARNEKPYAARVNKTWATLNKNKLFNGRTCNLPAQRAVPPFPKTICGSYTQCQKLAQDSCIKNLVDAETCALTLAKTKVHSSITSVSCGALLSSLNGEKYGIGAGLQDAITGYLDQHTKNMIDSGEYGKAFATGALRVLFTYMRTESCKTNFTDAAYAPIKRWKQRKAYIENEPYQAQKQCNTLIHHYNSAFDTSENNKSCMKKQQEQLVYLTKWIDKEKKASSVPKTCTFR
ncbi:hypothetical protein SG35_015460 [Thalassomonas actiniarum]|uniref:Lipoprotein n=2 Tax=Thalassomonas actiniarum TaxID=485447 RepID=A0AAF0C1B7_9GAMM|nr:hypothetical protein SG35_015460 [Thalassomonas actiniarum]